jgi:hypothetical protein
VFVFVIITDFVKIVAVIKYTYPYKVVELAVHGFFMLLKKAFLTFRLRSDKGKREAALVPLRAFGVGDLFGNIKTDRSAGKVLGVGVYG